MDSTVTGTTTFFLNGAGAQAVSAGGGTGAITSLIINKATGTLTLQDTIEVYGNLILVAGTVDASTSTVVFVGTSNGLNTYDASLGASSAVISFNDVEFTGGYDRTVTNVMDIDGDLTFTDVGAITGVVSGFSVAGNLTSTDIDIGGRAEPDPKSCRAPPMRSGTPSPFTSPALLTE